MRNYRTCQEYQQDDHRNVCGVNRDNGEYIVKE